MKQSTMRRWCRRFGALAVLAAVLWAPGLAIGADAADVADAVDADASADAPIRLEAQPIRSYDVPGGFTLDNRQVTSTDEGRTLIASTTGQESDSRCTVIVATDESARAYPYQHTSGGTVCLGVLPQPNGGFFLRGIRAGAEGGEVAGFTARLDARGRERWIIPDTETAESPDFKGSYLQPHRSMAYSESTGYLLTFTLGKLTIGDLDEKRVTHLSVLEEGQMRTAAKTIGAGGGFGVVGGVTSLGASGDFLLYILTPAGSGAQFYRYDGRESVDQFEPLAEDWSDRFVRRMIYGPDQNIYLLWTEGKQKPGPARLTVVDQQEREVWSGEYPAEVAFGRETRSLGAPVDMWVGSRYAAVMYRASGIYLRLLDARDGDELGIVPLAGVTDETPLNIVRGREGRLTLLTVDQPAGRFYEYALSVETGQPGPDAGTGDVGLADAGGEGAAGGGCSGCSATGQPEGLPLVYLLAFLSVVGLARTVVRRLRCG